MATLSNDKTYCTVVKGDTLSQIAATYKSYTGGATYQQLAAINNISNPNLIYVGQKIYFASSGSSSSSTSSTSSKMATITAFGLQSNSDNTLFATWTWTQGNTAGYAIEWSYSTGDGVWFIGSSSTISVDENNPDASKQSTYTIPSNAKQVRFRVKPVSKTYMNSNSKETTYWTASWTSYKTWTDSTPFVAPSVPTVKLDKFKLTASLTNINIDDATAIQFQIVKNDTTVFKTGTATITTSSASYSCTVEAGGKYKVRCRVYNSSTNYGDWSDYSDNIETIPAASSGITTIKATSETSVYLEWGAADTATSYDIEYATKKDYFDGSDETTTRTGIEFTHYEVTGLETGSEYFFRVRAVNDNGNSTWSDIASVVIGKDPSAPTTYSSTTTAIVGEALNLYWIHNSEDNSSETYAELELYIDGVKETHTIKNTETDEDEKDKTKVYTIDTSSYSEGTKIQWRVRTAGVTKVYGDWSVQRTIDVYAPPTLALSVTNLDGDAFENLTSFPFYVYALAGPNTQTPIGYQLTITSNEIYETTDSVGNVKMVNAGEPVYSKFFDITNALLVEMSADNINLDNNISYTITCVVSMNSGLTAEASTTFTVAWEDLSYSPNAEIGIDSEALVAHVRPYCEESALTRYKVTKTGTTYTKTTETIDGGVYGTIVGGVTTTTGESVYNGTTADGTTLYYCEVVTKTLVEGVSLSLYRREFDGSFTELATGLSNTDHTFVTDPHPSLDYARYRVVAITDATGAVSFYDVPGRPTGETAVVIQWDEEWSNFDVSADDEMQQPPWSGSLLKLPYNIDISDSNDPDVSLVKYIGRSHPVSYYGTQMGSKSTWKVEIEKDDNDTLYALRRLQAWMGDAYVREPSGSGYWANIKVSFSQEHRELTIPVTLEVTRVEGGV